MPAKKKVTAARKTAKKAAAKKPMKKTVKEAYKKPIKKAAKKKAPAKPKKGATYRCGVCGVGIVVDEVCGCVEEHVFICCGKPMKKKGKKKAA